MRLEQFLRVACASAIVLPAAAGCEPDRPAHHPPTNADIASWRGAKAIELETHTYFSTQQREVRPLSDGSAMWVYSVCSTKRNAKCKQSAFSWTTECTARDKTRCCDHQFIVRDSAVESYRLLGACDVACGIRPDSKIAACQAEATSN